MDNYVISAVKQNTTLIKGTQSYGLDPAIELMVVGGAGAPSPSFVGIAQARTAFNFETVAIKTALANLGGKTGLAANNLVFWLQKLAEGNLRAGASQHMKATGATGMIIPQSITAAQGQAATISYLVIFTSSDGMASPLAVVTAQSLDAGQDVNAEVYTMGPVSVNGTDLEGVSSWTLNFGNGPWVNIRDGNIYPTEVGVMGQAPSFVVRSNDVTAFQTWGLDGIAQDASDSTVKLLDQAAGGARGSSPITFSIDEGLHHFQDLGAAHNAQIGGGVLMTPVYDGVADIIAITGIT